MSGGYSLSYDTPVVLQILFFCPLFARTIFFFCPLFARTIFFFCPLFARGSRQINNTNKKIRANLPAGKKKRFHYYVVLYGANRVLISTLGGAPRPAGRPPLFDPPDFCENVPKSFTYLFLHTFMSLSPRNTLVIGDSKAPTCRRRSPPQLPSKKYTSSNPSLVP